MSDPNSCINDGVFKMPTLMPARVQVCAFINYVCDFDGVFVILMQ